MFNRFFHGQVTKAEQFLGVPLPYMHHMVDVAPSAAWRLSRFQNVAKIKTKLQPEVIWTATVASSMVDDCGSCVQIGVNLARKEGVSREILDAIVHRQPERLSDELRDVYEFAETVTSGQDAPDDLRERLLERYGDRGMIDLSMAIAFHRVYPTLKRAMGFAKSCSLVTVTT